MGVDDLISDDQTWRLVWERTLTHAERHEIGKAVLRRRTPADPFERRLAAALAHRWARHTLWLVVVYGLWSLFWGGIGWNAVRVYGAATAWLPVACAAVGMVAVVACLAFRRRMTTLIASLAAGP